AARARGGGRGRAREARGSASAAGKDHRGDRAAQGGRMITGLACPGCGAPLIRDRRKTEFWYGPGSAAHRGSSSVAHRRALAALRCARDTMLAINTNAYGA